MELVELGGLTEDDWVALVAGEHEPFGPVGAGLQWRAKDRHVALRAADGRLLAAAGAVLVTVELERGERFEVVGVGGVIVNRSFRGRGLMTQLLEALLRIAEGMGPDRAMLFCRPELAAVYRRFDFREVPGPVWVDQAQGRVEMPMLSMWRPLRGVPEWPPGRAEVQGLPF
jgi:predicted GNAT family N-acyltransferase